MAKGRPTTLERPRSRLAAGGLRMPAEWEPHEATWISWPKNLETFGEKLPRVERIFIEMALALQSGEKVNILVDDEQSRERVAKMLEDAGADLSRKIIFHQAKTADVWVRDYGPIFVKQGNSRLMTKWVFNAWGGKYADLAEDTKVFERIGPGLGFEMRKTGMVLEGGSIDVNGKGTLITTEQCLLAKTRNPKLSRSQIESKLNEYLGAGNVIWLKEGVIGDDTDGHIDDIARFVDERTVLCAYEGDATDANHRALSENFKLLEKSRDQDGEPLIVKKLPMPGAVISPFGRLPASYANFYIGNKAVLLPVFGHARDEDAASILEEHFPARRVVPINCEHLVWGLGTIHCSTQQVPL